MEERKPILKMEPGQKAVVEFTYIPQGPKPNNFGGQSWLYGVKFDGIDMSWFVNSEFLAQKLGTATVGSKWELEKTQPNDNGISYTNVKCLSEAPQGSPQYYPPTAPQTATDRNKSILMQTSGKVVAMLGGTTPFSEEQKAAIRSNMEFIYGEFLKVGG